MIICHRPLTLCTMASKNWPIAIGIAANRPGVSLAASGVTPKNPDDSSTGSPSASTTTSPPSTIGLSMVARVVSRSTVSPLLSTVMTTIFPPLACAKLANSSHSATGEPSTATIVSPTSVPASAAGDGSSEDGRTSLTAAIVVVLTIWPSASVANVPQTATTTHNRTIATTKWLMIPASTTTDFCQNGAARYVRSSSKGSTSSNGFIPMMRTYPPKGMALTPYTVSPRVVDQSFGPNPKKASVAFMPNALAATK